MKPNILKNRLYATGWILLLLLSLYYIYHNCFRFFIFTEASYHSHFWPRANWLFIHIVSGIVATLLVPFQLIPALRKKHKTCTANSVIPISQVLYALLLLHFILQLLPGLILHILPALPILLLHGLALL